MVNSLGGKSGLSTRQRICASSLAMVMMSRTCGIFCRVTGSLVRSAAAIAGNAAFFAPLIRTVPSSLRPPWILNRSMLFPLACCARLFVSLRFERLPHVAAGLLQPSARVVYAGTCFQHNESHGQIVLRLTQCSLRV